MASARPADILPDLLMVFEQAERTRAPVMAQYALTVVAIVLALGGDAETASVVMSSARTAGELPFRSPGHYALFQHYGSMLHERLGDEVTARCRARGGGMPMHEAVALVRASEVGRAALRAD